MRKSPSKKMIRARSLRKKGHTLDEIAAVLKVTRQGAQWLIRRSDDFMAPPELGNYYGFKAFQQHRIMQK